MASTSVSIRSGVFSDDAQEISTEYFGGNMLFDRDRVGENGTFDEKADALNLGLLRYPGGNVTELFFDLENPEKTVEEAGHSGSLMPLSEFLAYVKDIDASAAFVAPTVPFMDGLATGEMTVDEVRSEMRAFLVELKAGVYGDPSVIKHIEIGNEYYGYDKHFDWSAIEQYIEIAPIWAEEIRDVFGDTLNIGVQGGISRAENDMLIDVFRDKGDLVDTVIFHSYPWDLGQAYSRDVWKTSLSDAWENAGISETVFMSEWGITSMRYQGGEELGTDRIEDGLARGIAMVEMAALQIKSGVDFATVWPVQQNVRGDLGGNEGDTAENSAHFLSEDGLTVAGEAFQMMSEVLPGMKMLDMGGAIDLDGKRENDRFAPELLVRGFEDDKKIVVFVSAWALADDLGEATINLDLGGGIGTYDITTLTVSGDNYLNANADPVTIEETGVKANGDLSITFTRDYELKRIVLHKDGSRESTPDPKAGFSDMEPTLVGDSSGDLLRGDDGADGVFGHGGNDVLFGEGAGDFLNGGAGADFLNGGDGFDFLLGGAGGDTLLGGRGDDSLNGAGADDRLKGQQGEDTLNGGAGDDTMIGGGQSDDLRGGGGSDFMKGGGGADVMNGGGGADRMFGNGGNDVLIGRGGADRLYGGAGADTLNGGGGNDVIEVGPGEDVATGGAGADVFIIRLTSETATITDFQDGQDLIAFYKADDFSDLTIAQDGADAIVSAGATTVVLEGVDSGQLGAEDFLF